jgi:hypothetical protein
VEEEEEEEVGGKEAEAEEEEEQEEEVYLGVIMTNTEIFHIFHIISPFNLPFSKFSISFHYSTYFSSIFCISFHISSIFSISFHNFLPHFPNLFTI